MGLFILFLQITVYYLTGLLLDQLVKSASRISFNFLRDHFKQLFPRRRICNVSIVRRRMFKLARTKVSSTVMVLANLRKELVKDRYTNMT